LSPDYLPGFQGNRFGLGVIYEPDMISPESEDLCPQPRMWWSSPVGFNTTTESEGMDRTFQLPWGQDALIEAAVAANPHAIVTLNGGGGMDTRRWLDKVPALLHLYYGGQEGGTAVAEVLFGKHDPEGSSTRQLRSQLGRQSFVSVLLPHQGRRHRASCDGDRWPQG